MERLPMDNDLHQVKEAPKPVKVNYLLFLRELAEKGIFGPKPLSMPRGEFVFLFPDSKIKEFRDKQPTEQISFDEKQRRHIAANGE